MKFRLLALIVALMLLFTGCAIDLNASNDNITTNDTNNGSQSGDDSSPVATDGHTDDDDNGLCDDCGISVIINFDFYAINDMHGKFADSDSMIGVDELTTFIKNSQNRDKNAVFLSSGDMWQGSSESNLTKGLIITEWMSALGFSSMTLGNHEFDWGEEYIKSNLAAASFPFLAINIYERDTNERVDYAKPSVVVEKSGLQIGIIGAIGDCYSSISADKVENIYFKTGSELTALVKAEADRLRSEGADFIVYSIHGDSSSYENELSNGYVDVVFEGHTHRNYVDKDSYGVYHIQNGADNDGISHVDVDINFANQKTSVNTAEVIKNSRYASLLDDSIVAELLEKYEEQISISQKVLGVNDKDRNKNELRSLNASLYYKAGVSKWGSQYDIALGGGYTSVRSPGYLEAGEVKYSHIQTLFPFDNTIQLCSIKGRDLISRFFETTNSDYFIYWEDYGESIRNNVDPNATYYIVTDSYNSSYAPNKLTVIADYAPDVFARDLIAEYIENGGFSASPPTPEIPDDSNNDNSSSDLPSDGDVNDEPNKDPFYPYTYVSDILDMFDTCAPGEESDEEYLVFATVERITNTTYGNMIVSDMNGDQIVVYGTYSADGSIRYDALDVKPQEGDMVILLSTVKRYTNESRGEDYMELYQAKLISTATPVSISSALDIAASLDEGAQTKELYAIAGEVADIESETWGNMTVKDELGDEIYVYGVYDLISGERYDAMDNKPQEGNLIILFAPIKKYVKDSKVTLELVNADIVIFI